MTGSIALGAQVPGLMHLALAEDLAALAERLRRSTVRIHTHRNGFQGVGAGVLWTRSTRQLVLTNAHVVPAGRGDQASVQDHSGRMAEARVLGRDAARDLALLGVDAPDEWPPPVALAEAVAPRVGEIVVALGHPFGVAGALSIGIVHAVPHAEESWIEADIRLAPGNSGGPLATLDGTVIGINSMIVRGLGIAVAAKTVRAFVAQVLALDDGDG